MTCPEKDCPRTGFHANFYRADHAAFWHLGWPAFHISDACVQRNNATQHSLIGSCDIISRNLSDPTHTRARAHTHTHTHRERERERERQTDIKKHPWTPRQWVWKAQISDYQDFSIFILHLTGLCQQLKITKPCFSSTRFIEELGIALPAGCIALIDAVTGLNPARSGWGSDGGPNPFWGEVLTARLWRDWQK